MKRQGERERKKAVCPSQNMKSFPFRVKKEWNEIVYLCLLRKTPNRDENSTSYPLLLTPDHHHDHHHEDATLIMRGKREDWQSLLSRFSLSRSWYYQSWFLSLSLSSSSLLRCAFYEVGTEGEKRGGIFGLSEGSVVPGLSLAPSLE